MTEQEIRELFKKHGVDLGQKDVWHVQNQPVIKHSALERLSAAIKIRWTKMHIVRAERDEAVVEVWAKNHEGVEEWSIGEAVIGLNYRVSGKQAAYVWAMAEKRAKDRVIIKLAGLHGAYSSEDAFELDEPAQARPDPVKHSPVEVQTEEPTESQKLIFAALGLGIEKASNQMELELFKTEEIKPQMAALTEKQQGDITALYKDRYRSLQRRAA